MEEKGLRCFYMLYTSFLPTFSQLKSSRCPVQNRLYTKPLVALHSAETLGYKTFWDDWFSSIKFALLCINIPWKVAWNPKTSPLTH